MVKYIFTSLTVYNSDNPVSKAIIFGFLCVLILSWVIKAFKKFMFRNKIKWYDVELQENKENVKNASYKN